MSYADTAIQSKYIVEDYFDDWTRFERAWLVSFTVLNVWLFLVWDDTLLGLVTSLSGMMTVVLVAKGRISNYYFGIVNVTLYAYTAIGNQFYGEVMLNLGYFLPAQFVGLYLWERNADPDRTDTVQARSLSNRRRIRWAGISVCAIVGYTLVLRALGGNLPLFDATSTVLSIIAQWLMIKRLTEQWLAWITIDIVSIYMWSRTFLATGTSITMVVMWSAFLVNALYGYYNWRAMEGTRR